MRAVRGRTPRVRKGLALNFALPHPLAPIPAETRGEDRSQRHRPFCPSGFIRMSTRAGEGASREHFGAGIARSITPGISTR